MPPLAKPTNDESIIQDMSLLDILRMNATISQGSFMIPPPILTGQVDPHPVPLSPAELLEIIEEALTIVEGDGSHVMDSDDDSANPSNRRASQ